MELAKLQILSPGGHGALLSNVANSMLFSCSDQVPDVVCPQLQVCNSKCIMLLTCVDCAVVKQTLPGYLHHSCFCVAVGCESTGQRGVSTTG